MNYKWTVLFLVHASGKQTSEHVNTLIKILKSTDYREEIKVLVLYGGLQTSETDGYRIQVTLREIVKDRLTGQLNFEEVLPGYGVMDIGDDSKLKKIFSSVRMKFPSERFLLLTWDHGSGFGIFKTNPGERSGSDFFLNFEMDIMQSGTRNTILSEKDIHFEVISNGVDLQSNNAELRGVNTAGKKKTSMLTNDELGKTLKYKNQGKKVDLLIMMNCAMQLVETGYALHETVEYLVAPETCIFWAGYDYKSIINKLCENPEIETELLGRFVIDTIQRHYEKARCKRFFNDLVISLVKPVKAKEVKCLVDDISICLISNLPDSLWKIKKIRKKCIDVTSKYVSGTPYHYIDLLNSIAGFKAVDDRIDIENLKMAVNQYVIHLTKGKNYNGSSLHPGIEKLNGCSIYFPPDAASAYDDMYYQWFYKSGYLQTLFARESGWRRFLSRYLTQDKRNTMRKSIT